MAKAGLARLKARDNTEHGNNVSTDSNENIKSMKSKPESNVLSTKEHRLVVDIPEDLYWQFKTASGTRRLKMKQAIADALELWIQHES